MSKVNNLPAFTEHERRLIVNCRDYAQNDPAGLPGHDLMMIIAKLFDLLIGHELDMNTQKEEGNDFEWYSNENGSVLLCYKGNIPLARVERYRNEWHYDVSGEIRKEANEHDAKACVEMILDENNT